MFYTKKKTAFSSSIHIFEPQPSFKFADCTPFHLLHVSNLGHLNIIQCNNLVVVLKLTRCNTAYLLEVTISS